MGLGLAGGLPGWEDDPKGTQKVGLFMALHLHNTGRLKMTLASSPKRTIASHLKDIIWEIFLPYSFITLMRRLSLDASASVHGSCALDINYNATFNGHP